MIPGMLIGLGWGGLAWAGTLTLTLEVVGEQVRVVSQQVSPEPGPASPRGPGDPAGLAVVDAAGRVLYAVPLAGALQRSVVLPEGGGAVARLHGGQVRLRLPWPAQAHALRLDGALLPPPAAPPMPEATATLVQGEGSPEERLDLVFLGDGYTAGELPGFAEDVERVVQYLGGVEPFGAYTRLFNIWRVDQASAESGASHREGGASDLRDTAYGCYYGCGGIDRLICCDDGAVLSAVNAAVPGADGVMVLVNDPTYGGSGGFSYATAYNGGMTGTQVAAHELGHSLVGLWDEYSYGVPYSGADGPNCAVDPDALPWEHWSDEAGAHPVCSYTNYYRPTDQGCMMNTLQDGYCPVCREEVVLAIYGHLPGMLLAVEPPEGPLVLAPGATHTLSASALGPDDGSLRWEWSLDGQVVGEGASFTLDGCPAGQTLSLRVWDPTPWVRADPEARLQDTASWTLDRAACPEDSAPADSGEGQDGGCGCGAPGGAALGPALLALGLAARRRLRLC